MTRDPLPTRPDPAPARPVSCGHARYAEQQGDGIKYRRCKDCGREWLVVADPEGE